MHGANDQHRAEERNQNDGGVWLRSGHHPGIASILPILVSGILTAIAITFVYAGLSYSGKYQGGGYESGHQIATHFMVLHIHP
jgi:hypothetical protein